MQYYTPLKAMITDQYKTESQAARALGWSRQRLNRITTGRKEPDLKEVDAIAKLLNRSIGEIAAIFLVNK